MLRGFFLNNNELRLNKTNKKLRFNSFKLVVKQFGCGYAAPGNSWTKLFGSSLRCFKYCVNTNYSVAFIYFALG
jgi:hypothetical protein